MDFFFLIPVLVITGASWLSWGIGRRVYNMRMNAGGSNARLLQVVSFIVSLVVILGVIFYLVITNIRIER